MAANERGESEALDVRYELDAARVAAELVNDEVVAIDFITGKYHGIRGSGVAVWRLLETGFSSREIIAHLTGGTSDFDDQAARAVTAFVSALERQGLIARSARSAPALAAEQGPFTGPFQAPELETRDDLSDYLTLDPIHDVDERGWPNARR